VRGSFATSLGNRLAGYFSGFFVANDRAVLMRLYGGIAAVVLATPSLKRLMAR